MTIARQSTAIIVTVGPVLDASGAAVTDCVVGDFKISKNGGAPAALNGSATLTHRHTGFYSLSLTTSDVATVGTGEVTIDDTVNCCPMKELTIIEESVYDAIFAGSADIGTAVWATAARTLTAATNITSTGGAIDLSAGGTVGIDWANVDNQSAAVDLENSTIATVNATGTVGGTVDAQIVTGGIGAAAFAANAITAAALAADVTTELQAGLATASNLAVVAGYLDTEISAILADTNELQTDWANGGRLDLLLDGCFTTSLMPANFPVLAISAGGLVSANAVQANGQTFEPITETEIADAVLTRSMASVEDDAPKYSLASSSLAIVNWAMGSGELTVKKTDGSTLHTYTVSSDAAAVPITGVAE